MNNNNISIVLQSYFKTHNIRIPFPTEEQINILHKIVVEKKHTIVSSIPGSGKTTLVQYISLLRLAIQSQNNSIKVNGEKRLEKINSNYEIDTLVLMYNKVLSLESQKKFKKSKCKNVKCQTIHSFAYTNYKTQNRSYDDTLLLDILKDNTMPINEFDYSLIIIDEFQDATDVLFRFVEKIIADNINDSPVILIMGDPLQELYSFRGADSRFMTLAQDVMLGGKLTFEKMKMSYTNRCPENICKFINTCYYGLNSKFEIMKSKKQGGKIRVCIGSLEKIIIQELKLLKINSVIFSMEDVMIIVPSLKNIGRLKSILSKNGIHVIVSDSEHINSKTTKDKVLITTFHGSKGLEKRVCFVSNFSTDYYKYYAVDFDQDVIPNTFYVALSRSSEYLYLIRNSSSEFPRWCNIDVLKELNSQNIIQLYEEPLQKIKCGSNDDSSINTMNEIKNKNICVTELTKNLSTDFKQEFSKIVKFNVLQKRSYNIDYPDVLCTNSSKNKTFFYDNGYKLYENISKYVGSSISIIFQFYLYYKQKRKGLVKNKYPLILDYIDECIYNMKTHNNNDNDNDKNKSININAFTKYYDKHIKSSENESIDFIDVLYYIVLYDSICSNDISILNQIRYLRNNITDIFSIPHESHGDDEDEMENNYDNSKLMTNLVEVCDIDYEAVFEYQVSCEIFNKNIIGKIDILCDNHIVIELKFKNSLDVEDLVQLFLYYCIMTISKPKLQYSYQIFNAKTGEKYALKYISFEKMKYLLNILINENKSNTQFKKLSNAEFIEKYKKEYYL